MDTVIMTERAETGIQNGRRGTGTGIERGVIGKEAIGTGVIEVIEIGRGIGRMIDIGRIDMRNRAADTMTRRGAAVIVMDTETEIGSTSKS